jgi:long-chain acyl-CoA synthetase
MLSYLPLSHVVERALVEHGQLATGMHVYFAESLDTFTTDLQRARPTVFFSVPRLWVKFQQGMLAKMPQKKLNTLLKHSHPGRHRAQEGAHGAGPAGLHLRRRWCRAHAGGAAASGTQAGPEPGEGYGMTENLGASHITEGDTTPGARWAGPTTTCSAASTRHWRDPGQGALD